MATDPREVILGRERCGCITVAHTGGHEIDPNFWDIPEFLASGGDIVRFATMDEAREQPHFLVSKCPHNPIGWGEHKGEQNPNLQTTIPVGEEGTHAR